MRPGAEDIFAADMAFFQTVVWWLNRFNIFSYMRWQEAIWELDQIMREETDYRFELSNIRLMRKQLCGHSVYVPRPFPKYCRRRVLVMEFLEGTLMSDYIQVSESDPERLAAWLDENHIEPERVGRRLFMSFMRQIVEENRFHGDLHPGNIMLLRNSRVAFIDFGTVGTLEQNLWRKYLFI